MYILLQILRSSYIVISVVGLVINILSISYFITNENKGLANKLMICLNFSDILSVITSIAYCGNSLMSTIMHYHNETLDTALYMAFNSFPAVSGCVTFAMTLLRTIVIYNPFFQIRKKLCIFSLAFIISLLLIFSLITWISEFSYTYVHYMLSGIIVVSISCLNIVMSTATIIILKKSSAEGHQERNYAGVTMVIISMIYFVTSFPILLAVVIPELFYYEYYNTDFMVYMVMLSLSSLLNPLIYIYRKHQIRSYAKERFLKLKVFCRS